MYDVSDDNGIVNKSSTTKRFTTGNDDTFIAVGSIERIRQEIRRKWEGPLKTEGIGKININDHGFNCEDEIESLLDYVKLFSFYNETELDRNNRRIFLADVAKNYLKRSTINSGIIPATSFVKTIIDNKAILYTKEPERRIFNSDADNATLQSLIDESNWDVKAQSFYNKLKLANLVAVRPIVNMVRGKQKLQFEIFTPDKFRVLLDNNNEVEKMLYEREIYTYEGREDVIYVWTKDQHYYLNCEGKQFAIPGNEQMVNPYGFIPFVFMQLNDEDGFFNGGNFDLIESVLDYNLIMLQTIDAAHFSTFNLLWAHDVNFSNTPDISSRDILFSNSNGLEHTNPQVAFINSKPFFAELNTQAINIYKQAAKINGVPAFLVSDSIQEFNSSRAMKTGMYVMLNERMKDSITMRDFEAELTLLVAKVINRENKLYGYPYKLNEEAVIKGFNIDYADPTFDSDDPIKDLELKEKLVEKHIMNMAQLYEEFNADSNSIEDSIVKIKENQRINNMFISQGISFKDMIVASTGNQTEQTQQPT